jgi:hypothetical protein
MPHQYVIWSVEHGAWRKTDGQVFALTLEDATKFSREDAQRIVRSRNLMEAADCMIPLYALTGAERFTTEKAHA